MTIVSGDIEVDVLLCSIGPPQTGHSIFSSKDYSLAVLHCNVAGDVLQRIAIVLKAVNVGTKVFTRVGDHYYIQLSVCFKLQHEDDGKTWAVPAIDGKASMFSQLRTWEFRVSSLDAIENRT